MSWIQIGTCKKDGCYTKILNVYIVDELKIVVFDDQIYENMCIL